MSNLSDVKLNLVTTVDEAFELLRWLGERHTGDCIGFDIETGQYPGNDPKDALSPYRGRVRLAQIGDENVGWAMDWNEWSGLFYEAMSKYDGDIVCHNIAFEASWMTKQSRWEFPWYRSHDTMLAAKIINPAGSGALKELTSRYIDRRAAAMQGMLDEVMKSNGWSWGTIPTTTPEYWSYGALDPVLTARLWNFLRKEGIENKYRRVYELEMATRRVVSQMELNGSPIDVDYCNDRYKALSDYVEQTKAWAKNEIGISIGSNTQLARYFEIAGAEITRFTKGGSPSVDKYQLDLWAQNPPNERVGYLSKMILDVRRADKLAGTYFANFISKNAGGILHPQIMTLGARTGRMSIRDPALQTLPRGETVVRDAFIPYPGESLVSCDYSQVEMRLMAHFSSDPAMAEAFTTADATGGDFFVELGKAIYTDPNFTKKDERRGLVKNCVPIKDTEILTKRGWLSYYDVRVGDETLGYDFDSGTTKWNRINEVVLSEDAKIYELGNANRSFKCTEDHRWVAEAGRRNRGTQGPRFIHASDHPGTEDRIILAAEAEDGTLPISEHEARILGWVLGDGTIKRTPLTETFATSQRRDGSRRAASMSLCQSKPDTIAEIDKLLTGVPHVRSESRDGKQTFWTFKSHWSRDLLERANIEGKKNFDPWALAAGLTGPARRAMIDSLAAADGKNSDRTQVAIVQAANTPVAELCVALGYLTGRFSRIATYEADGTGWQKNPISVIWHQTPTMTGQRTSLTYVGRGDTWCVSTELGSWTMRQSRKEPIITGNTLYGKAYGAGPEKMAETAGVPLNKMREVVDSVDSTYPGLKAFATQVDAMGQQRLRDEGVGYVLTPFGRRLPCDADRTYSLTNYLLQGHAAEILKEAIVRLDNAGYGSKMLLPVHDEVIFSIPNEDMDQAMHDIPEIMGVSNGTYSVNLLAEAEGPLDRWGTKYRKGNKPIAMETVSE